ncbi:MAG: hypothetical protein FJX84_01245 [Bacteroidetes bacterium]|nr:hypothetical protein [Bacteroidota bacterium]
MQKFIVLTLMFLSLNIAAQISSYENTNKYNKGLTLKNYEIIYSDSKIYTYQNFVFIKNYRVWNSENESKEINGLIKIHKDSIHKIHIATEELRSDKVSYYLDKFASESQTGIGLQVLGTALSIGLSLINVSPYIYLTLPPAISVTGFIIWASSYRHLKRFHLISEAKDYFTTP